MRRRRFSRGRRGRSPTAWMTNSQVYGGTINPGNNTVNQLTIVDTYATPTANLELDRATVMRVVGDVYVQPGNTNNSYNAGDWYYFGLGVVVDRVSAAGQAIFDPLNLRDALADWLWLYHDAFNCGTANSMMPGVPYKIRIPVDIRVKRRLAGDSRLSFMFSWAIGAAAGTAWSNMACTTYLRCLVGRVE